MTTENINQPRRRKGRTSTATQGAQWQFQADLLDQLGDAVIAVDQEERITYLNRAAVAQYRVDGASVLGQPLRYLYRYEWLQPEDELLADAALAQQGHWRGENRHICQDGSTLHVEALVTVLHDGAGNATGLLTTIRDITDRKQMERDLRASELRYRRLADTMPQLIWTADAKGVTDYYNIHIHDFDPSVWQGSTGFDWESLLHPEDQAPTLAAWQQAVSRRQPYSCEHRLHMADDTWRWHLSRAVLVQDPDNRLKWYGTATDIHDRKLAEEQLKFHASLLDYAYDAVIATDADLNITAWNRGAEEMYGWSAAEVLGRKPYEVLRSTMTPEMRAEAVRQMTESGRFCVESTTYRRDGVPILVEGHSVAMRDDNGRITGYMSISRDIRERKAAEEALRVSEERYRTLFETMDEGFCLFEMLYNGAGQPVDYRFLEVNPTFARFTGLANAVGKTAYELVPNLEPHWVEIYGEVARTGEARHFIEGSAAMGRWFEVHAFRFGGPESRRVALLFTDITERKLIEDALRDSEEELRYTVELNPQVPWTADPAGNITSFSQRWLDLTGLTEEAALGGGWVQAPYPADLPAMTAAWTHAIQSGEPYDVEHRIRLADGGYRWMRSRAFPRRDANGAIVRWYGATEDIHERKLAEEELRRTTARFERAERAANAFVFESDLVSGQVVRSPNFTALTGYAQDEVAPTVAGWLALIHPDDRAHFGKQDLLTDGATSYSGEYRVRHKDGYYFWVQEQGLIEHNAAGRALAIVGTTLDITERKQAEEALRASEARFRTLANTVPSIIWTAAPDGTITYANDQWFDYCGLTPAENARQWPQLVLHPDDFERCVTQWSDALESGEPYVIEVRNRRYDGVYRWFLTRATPLHDAEGRITAWFGATTDIDERKQAELNQQLLDRISLLLAGSTDLDLLLWSVTGQVGEFFAGYRCGFADIDMKTGTSVLHHDWVAANAISVAGRYRNEDFLSAEFMATLRKDEPVVVNDVTQDPRTALYADNWAPFGIAAFAFVPIFRAGEWRALFFVHFDKSHVWRNDEVQLLRDVAARVWPAVERMRAEEALRTSEERLRLATEAGGVGIFDHDLIANQTVISALYAQITGLPPATVVTHEVWLACVHPEDRPLVEGIWQAAQATGASYYYECRLIRPDGALVWIEVNAWVTPDDSGRGVRITGAVRDITERKQAALHQQFLLDLNSTLRTLSDATAIQQTVVEQLGQYLGADRCRFNAVDLSADKSTLLAAWSRPGLPPPTDINPLSALAPAAYITSAQAGRTLVIQDAHQDEQNEIAKALMLAHGFVATIRVPCLREGAWVASLHVLQTTPRQWRADEVELVESVVHHFWPLAEKLRLNQELRYVNERFLLAEAAVPGWVYDYDWRSGHVTRSDGFQRVLGYPPEECQPTAEWWRSLIHPDDWQWLRRELGPLSQPGDRRILEYRVRDRNGQYHHMWDRARVIRDERGEIVRLVGSSVDITERKQMEEALHASEARFRAVQQASPDGYMIFESVRNEQGVISDFRWLYLNPASEEMIGRRAQDLLGKRLLEEMPGNREEGLFDAYVRVVETGELYQREFCYQHEGIDRWFRTTAAKAGNGFAVTFSDITARKQAEADQQLLADLAEQIRLTDEPEKLISAAVRLVGDHLQVGRCLWIEIYAAEQRGFIHAQHCRDLPPVPETYVNADYSPITRAELTAGRILVNHDAQQDPRTAAFYATTYAPYQERAYIGVPFLQEGRWRGLLSVTAPEARQWQVREIHLLETVAERMWLAVEKLHLHTVLRANEAHLRQALTAASAGGWFYDLVEDTAHWSPEMFDLYGLSPALGAPTLTAFATLIHPADRAQANADMAAAVQRGGQFAVEFRVVRADGQERWINSSGVVDLNAAGEPVAASGIDQDITVRKQAEIALQQSNVILQGVLECSNDAIFVRDLTGRYLLVNEAGTKQVGLPKHAILGQRYQDLFTAAEVATIREDDHPVLAQGQTVTLEHVSEEQGAQRYWHTLKMPLRNAAGEIVGLISSARDLTEGKAAEAALRLSEARFRHLAEAIPQVVWTCQADGSMTYINQQWQQYSGLAPATTLEQGMWPAIHPDDLAPNREEWRQALTSGSAYEGEVRYRRCDGVYRWFLERAIPVRDEVGVIQQWFGVSMDIDDRKEAERRQAELVALLEAMLENAPVGFAFLDREQRFVRINQVLADQHGRTIADHMGRTFAEIAPRAAKGVGPLLDQVFATGEGIYNREISGPKVADPNVIIHALTSWFPVAVKGVTQYVGVMIVDITERKRQERHQQFLSELGMDLRLSSDSATILTQLVSRLGEYLQIAGCRVNEVDLQRGQFTLQKDWVAADAPWPAITTPGLYPLAELAPPPLLASLQAGQTVVVVNTLRDPRTTSVADNYENDQVRSLIGVPIFRQGEWCATLSVKGHGERQWRADEVALLEAVAGQLSALLEKVRAEEALRASEERLRLALAGGGMGIWESQVATNRSLWSPEEYVLFGLPTGVEITNELFNRLVHPADLPGLQVAMQRLFSSGNDHIGEFRIIRPDGAVRWLADRVTVLRDDADQPVRLLGINFDITERKEQEALIRQQLAEIEAIYATAPVGLCLMDRTLRYVRVNEMLATMNQRSVADLLGRTLQETGPEEGFQIVAPLYRHVIETGEPLLNQEVHENYVDPMQARDWLASYYPLKQPDGSVTGVNAVIVEITERKRQERQMQELNRQLRESNATLEERVWERTKALEQANQALAVTNQELAQFTTAAAHDLRTPLRGIANLVQWISEDAASVLPSASQRHLDKLGGRVKRLEKMLEDMLAYSRAGRVRYLPESVDLQPLLQNLIDLLAPPPGFVIKPVTTLPTLRIQRIPLELIFRNLLSNAIRHHHNPASGQVEIAVRDQGAWYEFCISDNGPGIDPQFHERIFGMFQTLKPRDQVEGSGIGLALVKKIVEGSGGRIWLESALGQGTAVYFAWPKQPQEQKAEDRETTGRGQGE